MCRRNVNAERDRHMRKQGLSQEGLKLIACVTMLIDHIGATLVALLFLRSPIDTPEYMWFSRLYYGMRIIGRIAFPIYCFLLVEGAHRTRNPKKYALRLFIGMLLSEIPFDLAFSPTWLDHDWNLLTPLLGFNREFNSVMITLLLGFFMIEAMKRVKGMWKAVMILPFYLLAELLYTDYAGMGILLIAVFALTRGREHESWLRFAGCAVVLCADIGMMLRYGIGYDLESFAMFALIPIALYDGRKLTKSKVVQWAFYLFYPVHLALLVLLQGLIFNHWL